MKLLTLKCTRGVLALSVCGLFVPRLICAQGFVYLSNTNQPVAESSLTGSFGIGFTTGTNPSGYLLDSLTLLFADNSTPPLVSAGLADYSTITYFGGAVEVGAAGYYTFTPNSPLALGADTSYALLVYPDDAQVDVNVSYTTSTAFSSIDNWNIPGLDGSDEPLFAITAIPAPEPSVASLACAGIFAFIVVWVTKRYDFSRTNLNANHDHDA